MSFDIDIVKTVRSAGSQGSKREFTLKVRFLTRSKRSVIFGPSGAGKTLTLQAIAGLLTPDRGRIVCDTDVLFDHSAHIDIPARTRRLGYLFQDYALFPKLNVRQNIAFGLQTGWRNPARHTDGDAVDYWLDAFELEEVASQLPHELSGGQRQRTALARALAPGPRALLLDEPFSALDPGLRARMRSELDELLKRVDIPILMITHDPEDLQWFGDNAFFMRDGSIEQDHTRPDLPTPGPIQQKESR